MPDIAVRLYYRQPDGKMVDGEQDFDLKSFGGFLPMIGDLILDPGVLVNRDRREPQNRRMWKVVTRVFNPRDIEDCVVLVVEESIPTEDVYSLLPQG